MPAFVICEEIPNPSREALLLILELGTAMAEELANELGPFSHPPLPPPRSLLSCCSYTLNVVQSSFCSRRTAGDTVARSRLVPSPPLPVSHLPETEIQSLLF